MLVILIWLVSISYIRHGLPGTHPRADRLEMLAQIGEAMTITNVLFAGLGFLALIVTIWFQRKQVEAAMDAMAEQASHGLIREFVQIGRRSHFCAAKFSAGATRELSRLVRLFDNTSNCVHT